MQTCRHARGFSLPDRGPRGGDGGVNLPRIVLLAPALAIALPAAEVNLHGHRFTLPEGFTIERAAGPDLAPRPVSASFDEDGFLYVTDSDGSNAPPAEQLKNPGGRILRLEDGDGDGLFDRSVVFADLVMFPQGCLWHRGWVYVAAPPSIWRFRDGDGDGVAEQREEWFQGGTLTGCANDIHGPHAGPDGFLYWTKGAFSEQIHPLADGTTLNDRAAHILRMRPDGTGLSVVMTGGMDNPVEVDLTPEGEVLFTSTFIDFTQPGFRDGVGHARYGAVFGKENDVLRDGRVVHADPVLAQPFVQLGAFAPSGLCRYPETAFGPGHVDNLFVTSFNLRKVTRHALRRDGATFAAETTDFLVSDQVDFHPTDVLPDADGSLLVVDTGGWYKLCCPSSQLAKADVLGGIYRVRRGDAPRITDPRGRRFSWSEATLDALVGRARRGTPALRERCFDRLARLGDDGARRLADLVLEPGDIALRRDALWALSRSDSPVARRAVDKLLDDENRELATTAARIVALDPAPVPDPARLERIRGAWSSASTRNDAARMLPLTEALGRRKDAASVPALVEVLPRVAPGDALAVGITRALIDIGDPAAVRGGLAHDSPAVRRAVLMALDQMSGGGLAPADVAPHLTHPDAGMRSAAGWIVGRHGEWGEPLAGWFSGRLLDAGLGAGEREALEARLGILVDSPAGQHLLATLVTRSGVAASTRESALRAIAGAGMKSPPAAWIGAVRDCLATAPDPAVVRAARRLAGDAGLAEALLATGRRSRLDPSLREAAYAALPAGWAATPADFDFLTRGGGGRMTRTAAESLARARLADTQRLELAGMAGAAGPLELLALLPAFEPGGDDSLARRLVEALG